jgi:hypothetical protein
MEPNMCFWLRIMAVVAAKFLTRILLISGMRFGLMQTKVGLVSILSKYQLSVSKETTVPLVLDPKTFIISPVGGMWLQIKKRVK